MYSVEFSETAENQFNKLEKNVQFLSSTNA